MGARLSKFKALFKSLESYQASVALFIALIATAIAVWQVRDARKAAEAQTYLEMRQRYSEIAQKLHGYEDIVIDRESEQWKDFKNYWYISFDEWYVTRKLHVFPDLWATYYSEAFTRALTKVSYRSVFCELRAVDFSEGIRREFMREVESTYESTTGEKLPCT